MQKMFKKTLVLLVTVCLAMSLLPVTAVAEQDGDWTYEIEGSSAVITGYTGSATSITIPAQISDHGTMYWVSRVGDHALADNTNITSVFFGSNIAEIGIGAFSGCTNLTTLDWVYNLEKIDSAAFAGCTKLTTISLFPPTITYIAGNAFANCSSLTGFDTYAHSSNISCVDGVLFNRSKTRLIAYPAGKAAGNYTIPAGVTEIGSYAFEGCANVKSVTFPATGLTQIGEGAFEGSGLSGNVTIPDGVTTINGSTFLRCKDLTSVTFPSSLTSIGEVAFYESGLAGDFAIPASVNTIGEEAFSETPITSVSVHSGVSTIATRAFDSCEKLAAINVAAGNSAYSSQNGVLFNKDATTLITYPGGKTDASYTVPGTVTQIATWAFTDTRASSITLPSGLTEIANCTFCRGNLTSITIPNNVTRIVLCAFSGCDNLRSVTLGSGLTQISSAGFAECSNLRDVYFLGNAPTLGHSDEGEAFEGASANLVLFHSATATGYTEAWRKGYAMAVFDPAILCTVTYGLNGSAGTPATDTVYKGGRVFPPSDPSRTNYQFQGWYKESACTHAWNFNTDTVNGNTTLHAKWEKTAFTVTFNLNGAAGTAPASLIVNKGGHASRPADPVRAGYTFGGWYREAACTHAWSFGADAVNADTVLYAKWTGGVPSVNLSGITLSAGARFSTAKPFSPTKATCTIYLNENTPTVTITPTKAYDSAAMKIQSQSVTRYTTPAIPNGKYMYVKVKVSIPGKSRTYTLKVQRDKSTDSYLSKITTNRTESITPAFSKTNTGPYTLELGENTPSVKIYGAAEAGKLAKVYYSGRKYTLNNGQTKTATIKVKPQSGPARTYTVIIHRAKSTNADLKSLKTDSNAYRVQPVFNAGVTAYTVTLPANKSYVYLYAVKAESHASMTMNGLKRTSLKVTVPPGSVATVHIIVTAQAGGTKDYVVTIRRP